MARAIGIGKPTMMTMTGLEVDTDLSKPEVQQYTSPITSITPLLHTFKKIDNKATKKRKQEIFSHQYTNLCESVQCPTNKLHSSPWADQNQSLWRSTKVYQDHILRKIKYNRC